VKKIKTIKGYNDLNFIHIRVPDLLRNYDNYFKNTEKKVVL
jgi:hypothetical protein